MSFVAEASLPGQGGGHAHNTTGRGRPSGRHLAGGAAATMALVMPVSWVMKGGIGTPVFIRLWKRSTMRPPSVITMATSVARSPRVGETPVVSKSMAAMRSG